MRQRKNANKDHSSLSDDPREILRRLLQEKGIREEDLASFLVREKDELQRILQRISREEIRIPLTLISQQQLRSLEAICQYLRDTRALTYAQIATLLNRDPSTIWTSCSVADKSGIKLSIPADDFSIPLKILADRKLSVLESVVVYLREHGYKPFQIADLLKRDQRVIATVWQRAQRKRRATGSDAAAGVAA